MKDILDIKTWPPGTLMLFDNREQLRKFPNEARRAGMTPHTGIGIVVYNDGDKKVHVVWGSNCKDVYCEYDVTTLNSLVIGHVG